MKRALVLLVTLALGCGKPAAEPPPGCEPPGPTGEGLYRQVASPGWDAEELARDIALIHSAIQVSQGAGAPPSAEFVAAKRAFDAERWVEAADGFRTVAKRNGADDRATRQTAQFYFAIALYRLKFTTEAASILRDVRSQDGHPKQHEASEWLVTKWCER
jgi:TolA-binding protein